MSDASDPWTADLDGPVLWSSELDSWVEYRVRPDSLAFGENDKKYKVLFIDLHAPDYDDEQFEKQEVPFFCGKEFRKSLKAHKDFAEVKFEYRRTKDGKINSAEFRNWEAM